MCALLCLAFTWVLEICGSFSSAAQGLAQLLTVSLQPLLPQCWGLSLGKLLYPVSISAASIYLGRQTFQLSLSFYFANKNSGARCWGWKPACSEWQRKQPDDLPLLPSETKLLKLPPFCFLCLSFSDLPTFSLSLSVVTTNQLIGCSASWPMVDFI